MTDVPGALPREGDALRSEAATRPFEALAFFSPRFATVRAERIVGMFVVFGWPQGGEMKFRPLKGQGR